MDNKQDIGKAVKSRLSKIEQSPKNLSWEKIEAQLNENKRDRKFFLFKKRNLAAIILLLVSSGSIIYQQYFYSKPHNNQTINNKIVNHQNNHNTIENPIVKNQFSHSEKTNTVFDSLHLNSSSKDSDKSIAIDLKNHINQTKSALKSKTIDNLGKTSNHQNTVVSNASHIHNTKKTNKAQPNKQYYNLLNGNKTEVATNKINSEKTIEKNIDTMIYMQAEKQELANKSKKSVSFISAHITPNYTYTNNLNESLISNRIGSNSDKTGKTSLSYGASLGFKLTNKATLRFGYDRITTKFEETNILNETIINTTSSLEIALSENIQNQLTISEFSSLTQQINYHKASVGFLYKIYNKKIATSISGDLGFLFQEKNELALITNNQTYKIGQNKNILDGNVSFDLGLNISYPLYKKIHFFVEPQIEYYIFTNENTSNNPFIFNLRTGVQFNLSNKKQL